MKKNQDQPADAAELRRRAEARLAARESIPQSAIRNPQSEARLVHELQVHQIELEMQNEELQQARNTADALLAQYTDLYDFAPAGYLTLDREGAIRQLNLTGALLLGIERSRLAQRRFGLFVAEGDRHAFSDFLDKVFASEAKECCEVALSREGSQPLVVRIEGRRSEDGQECRAVVLDITARRHAEEQTRAANAETQRLLAVSDQSRRTLLSAAEDEREATAELAQIHAQHELILNSVAEGIIGLDLQGNHTFVNPAAERMLGWQAGELIGRDSHSLWHHHNPDGTPYPKEECKIQATYRTGKVHHSAAEWFWRKDGTSFPVEYDSTPICEGGKILGAVLTFTDITERKRAEAAIHASRQLIEGIINALPVRVFWKDKNLVYLGCNAVFAHDAGLADPQDIVGKDDYQMGWSEQAEIYRADDRQVIESGCARLHIEEPQTTPSGNTITLLTSKIPLRNVQGEIDGVIGVYMDITDRKRAEERLAQEHDLSEAILNNTPGLFYLLTEKGQFLRWNRLLETVSGYTGEEIARMHPLELFPAEHKELVAKQILRVFETGLGQVEANLLTKQGEQLPFYFTGGTVIVDGQPCLAGAGTDITERKRAEEALRKKEAELRAILDATPFPVAMVDLEDTNIEFWSRSALSLFGHIAPTASEWYQLAYPDPDYLREVLAQWTPALEKARRSGQSVNAGEYRVTCSDGSTRLCELYAIFLADKLIVTFNDITTRKQAEEDVRILNANLERRVHERTAELQAALKDVQEAKTLLLRNDKLTALGRMSAGLIHEINNPLNYATQGLSVLEMTSADLPEPVRGEFLETLSDVKDGVARVAHIVSDLRGFTRGAGGHSQTFELRPVVDRTLRFFAHQFKHGVGIEADVPEAITVRGDPNQVVQVLVNLLQNAIDAMHAKQYEAGVSPAISITATSADRWVFLKIRDNGPGIPPAIIGNIFDPFFTTWDIGHGMGLGLTICHRIMAEHGGGIDVCSEPGVFSEFVLTFPQPDTGATAAPVGEGPPGKDGGANTG